MVHHAVGFLVANSSELGDIRLLFLLVSWCRLELNWCSECLVLNLRELLLHIRKLLYVLSWLQFHLVAYFCLDECMRASYEAASVTSLKVLGYPRRLLFGYPQVNNICCND